jgi:hypothetical protein
VATRQRLRHALSAHKLWICANESSADSVLDEREFLTKLLRLNFCCLRTKLCCCGIILSNCDTSCCLLQCSRCVLKFAVGLVDSFTPVALSDLDSLPSELQPILSTLTRRLRASFRLPDLLWH